MDKTSKTMVLFLFLGLPQALEGAENDIKNAITSLAEISSLNSEDDTTRFLNAVRTLKVNLPNSESDASHLSEFIQKMRNKVGGKSNPRSVLLTDERGLTIFKKLTNPLIKSGSYELFPNWDALHLCNALPQGNVEIAQQCEDTVSSFVSSLIRQNPSGNEEWEDALPFIENETIKSRVRMELQGSTQLQKRTHPQRNLRPRPHQCDQCEKCFSRRCALEQHKKKECSGPRPYVCRHCSKRFADHDRSEAHQKRHSSSSSSSSSARSTKSS